MWYFHTKKNFNTFEKTTFKCCYKTLGQLATMYHMCYMINLTIFTGYKVYDIKLYVCISVFSQPTIHDFVHCHPVLKQKPSRGKRTRKRAKTES